MPPLSPALWEAIQRHWCLGSYSVEGLARKFSISPKTIHYHAREKKWPARGSMRGDVELTLRTQSDDLWRELSETSIRLRGIDPPEDPADARDRLVLIRLWQRAMTALRGFELTRLQTAKPPKPQQITFTKTDELAVITKLDRLLAEGGHPD